MLQCVAREVPRRSLSLPEKRTESPRHIFFTLTAKPLDYFVLPEKSNGLAAIKLKIVVAGSIPGSDKEKKIKRKIK